MECAEIIQVELATRKKLTTVEWKLLRVSWFCNIAAKFAFKWVDFLNVLQE